MKNSTRKIKTALPALMFIICVAIALMLGVVFASPTATASAEEGGTPPTIIRTGGIPVEPGAFTAGFPYAIVGQPYKAPDGSNYKVEATGTQPITFKARYGGAYGSMPEGLFLDPDTGEITGTPTKAEKNQGILIDAINAYGKYSIMAQLFVYDETYKPTINSPAAGALPTGYVNSVYYQYINVKSNTVEEATLTVTNGSLPGGLSIQSAGLTKFEITGTPTTAGTFTFTLRVENPVGFDEKEYTIVINEDIERANIVRYPSGSDYAIKGKYYEFQCEATGTNTAENPILFFVKDASGNDTPNAKGEYDLGNGLSLTKDGKIYGTPTTEDQVSFTLMVKNKNEYGNYLEDSRYCYIVVKEDGTISSVSVTPDSASVPQGGKMVFTATVSGYGDYDDTVTWNVYYNNSPDTTIDQNGVLTVGGDETATQIKVEAKAVDGSLKKVATVTIVEHTHETKLVPAKDKTCTQDGNIEHYVCTICGAFFEDEGATILLAEDEVVIPASHEYGALIDRVEPTCSAAGMQAHYKCSVCNKYFDEHKAETTAEALTVAIDPDAHAFGEWIATVRADCANTGTLGHKDCKLCKKHFDTYGNEFTDLTIPIDPYAHNLGEWIEEVPATCTNTGIEGHYDCTLCGKHFIYVGEEVTDTDLTIPVDPNAHDYGEPRYEWLSDSECKAERVCKHDESHIETETVTASESVVTEATCEQKGKIKYTATFTNSAFATQSHEAETDYAPHTFGEWKEEVAPTTESNGIMAHKDCTVCGKHFDENGEEIADLTIPKIGTYRLTVENGTGGGIIAEGASVTITADEITGKRFTGWTLDGVTVEDLSAKVITFNMPASDVTATANYEYIDYTVTVVGGTAYTDGDPAESITAEYGDCINIVAEVPTGKRFVRWTSDSAEVVFDSETSNFTSFEMPASDVTVTAVFEDIDYMVTVTDGTADKATAHYGDSVTITADEITGAEFGRWEITGLDTSGLDLTKAELTFTMPASDVTATAIYEYIDYTVTVVGGTCNNGGENAESITAEYGDCINIVAEVPTGKRFVRWTSDSAEVVFDSETSNFTSFEMPASDVVVTAVFEDIDYTVTVTDGTADKSTAHYGDTVKITAGEAPEGKVFDKWTCETAGVTIEFASATSASTTFIMPAGDITVKANYRNVEEAPSFEIKVEGGTGAGTYKEGDSVTVTAAEPEEGKIFKGWQDADGNIVSTDVSYTFTVSKNISLTAVYGDIEYTVTINGGTGGGVYKEGDSITVTAAEPEEGKVFKGWQDADGNIVSTDMSYTFTVSGEVSLTAVYEDKPDGGETGGNITPAPEKKGLGGGAIAGIVIASVAVVGMGGFAIFWFVIKKKSFADLIAAIKKPFTKK